LSDLIKGESVAVPISRFTDVLEEVEAHRLPGAGVSLDADGRLTVPREAEPWRERLEAMAEEIRSQAARIGLEKGYAQGREEATRACHNMLEEHKRALSAAVSELVQEIESQRGRVMTEARDEIVDLALAVAGRILKEEVTSRRDVVMNIVKDALKRVVDKDLVRIRVNTADLETVKSHRDEIVALVDGIRSLEIVEDRRVGPGGAVVETNAGRVDARIETQLDEIRRAFSEAGE
jgi:flagellar assembly protein FliH